MTENEEMVQDELEKKISEAEMEAQLAQHSEREASATAEGPAKSAPEKKGLSKTRLIWRRILVWLVVLALVFAGGFFVDTVMRYQPEKDQVEALLAELDDAKASISDLEAEIERLSVFEEQNAALQEEISQLSTHLILLSARSAVADAALALEQEQLADARLFLGQVGSTLDDLKALVSADQAEVVENMIQRQELILLELDNDAFAAQTDLEVLASKLSALENILFAAP